MSRIESWQEALCRDGPKTHPACARPEAQQRNSCHRSCAPRACAAATAQPVSRFRHAMTAKIPQKSHMPKVKKLSSCATLAWIPRNLLPSIPKTKKLHPRKDASLKQPDDGGGPRWGLGATLWPPKPKLGPRASKKSGKPSCRFQSEVAQNHSSRERRRHRRRRRGRRPLVLGAMPEYRYCCSASANLLLPAAQD